MNFYSWIFIAEMIVITLIGAYVTPRLYGWERVLCGILTALLMLGIGYTIAITYK